MTHDKSYWFEQAKAASRLCGWFPTVILAQWQWETTYQGLPFNSPVFVKNNNLAGQTWRDYMPLSMKGSPRPAAEGGYYIRYESALDGYVDFIKKNGRYSKVKDETTEEGQIRAIAAAGWAADPEYATHLIKTLNANKLQGFVMEVKPEMERWVGATIVNTWMKPAYEKAKAEGNQTDMDNIRLLGIKVRLACGMKEDEEFE